MQIQVRRRKSRPQVALLTTFYTTDTGYSIVTVATNQIRMLMEHGYNPVRVLVQEGMPVRQTSGPDTLVPFQTASPPGVWDRAKIDLRPVIPPLHLVQGIADDFEKRVAQIEEVLYENLQDVNVCITHDIVLLDVYHEHNVAMRRVAQRLPGLVWLHWVHSTPTQVTPMTYPEMCRGLAAPGYFVYPNYSEKAYVDRSYRLAGEPWRSVCCDSAHAVDLLHKWQFRPETLKIARATGLLEADVGMIYPARMGRSKQIHKIIMLLAGVKDSGYTGCLIGVDWQSLGEEFMEYKRYCCDLAEKLNIRSWLHFASEIDDRFVAGVDPRVVGELFYLTNVYAHPSISETCGLTVIEAAVLGGNLLALNFDLRVHLEKFKDYAIYFDFGSMEIQRKWKPKHRQREIAQWKIEGKRLITELTLHNRALWARTQMRKEWSLRQGWCKFEPLLYLDPLEGHPGPWWPNETTKEPPPNA